LASTISRTQQQQQQQIPQPPTVEEVVITETIPGEDQELNLLREYNLTNWKTKDSWKILFSQDFQQQCSNFMEQAILTPYELFVSDNTTVYGLLTNKGVPIDAQVRVVPRLAEARAAWNRQQRVENTSLNQTLLPDELPKFREHLVSDLDKNVKLFNWNVNANIIENLTNFELHLIGKGILTNQIFPVQACKRPIIDEVAVFNSEATLRNKPWSDICKLVRRILEPGKHETDYEVELYSLEFFDKSSVRSCVNKFKAYAKYTDLKQSVLIEKFLLKVKCTRYHDMLRYHNTRKQTIFVMWKLPSTSSLVVKAHY
jgi:hypothetical protein